MAGLRCVYLNRSGRQAGRRASHACRVHRPYRHSGRKAQQLRFRQSRIADQNHMRTAARLHRLRSGTNHHAVRRCPAASCRSLRCRATPCARRRRRRASVHAAAQRQQHRQLHQIHAMYLRAERAQHFVAHAQLAVALDALLPLGANAHQVLGHVAHRHNRSALLLAADAVRAQRDRHVGAAAGLQGTPAQLDGAAVRGCCVLPIYSFVAVF